MSNAIYERLMNDLAKKEQNMLNSIIARIKTLKAEGNENEQVYAILANEGIGDEILKTSINAVEKGFVSGMKPPKKYADVKHIIQATLYIYDPKEIIKTLTSKTHFGQIMPQEHAENLGLEEILAYCQNSESKKVAEEIHEILKPYVENMITHMNMVAQNKKTIKASNDMEQKTIDRYFEWLGIWPSETQKAFNKTASFSGNEIVEVENECGTTNTFCPMYKTEVNIGKICSTCGFYEEIKVASGDGVSKHCRFSK
jgi:hypothetical protein